MKAGALIDRVWCRPPIFRTRSPCALPSASSNNTAQPSGSSHTQRARATGKNRRVPLNTDPRLPMAQPPMPAGALLGIDVRCGMLIKEGKTMRPDERRGLLRVLRVSFYGRSPPSPPCPASVVTR
jgi:hypothetical protein